MSDQQQTYVIRPIGYIRSTEDGFHLEILEPFRPALKQLDQFSHVLVFWWADKHDNDADRSTMQTELPYARGTQAGVFACRAEYRPNPIALTICPVFYVDEETGVVGIPWIDAFDGTPLVDLKPYIPVSERIRDVEVAEWLADWPEWMEDAGAFFADADIDLG
jgi:tRNA-Thr(GGU) m(6)t(6)A37 methyltransferase TsaA